MKHFIKAGKIIIYYFAPVIFFGLHTFFPAQFPLSIFGTGALYSLALIVFVRPLSVLFPTTILRKIILARRELGILSMWLYFTHSSGYIRSGYVTIPELFDFSSFIFFGYLAGVGMVIMGITSNNHSMRLLKRNWKRLHRIVYIVFLFALYHASRAEGEMLKFYIGAFIFITLKSAEWYLTRKKPLK